MTVYYTPTRPFGRTVSSARSAAIDLYRDGDTYVLSADMPGIDPNSVDVDIEGKVLTISGQRVQPSAEGITWLAKERATGSFTRRFTLGDGVDASAISASYDNGVLNVTVPVAERAKPRKVTVSVGAAEASADVEATDVETADVEAPAAA